MLYSPTGLLSVSSLTSNLSLADTTARPSSNSSYSITTCSLFLVLIYLPLLLLQSSLPLLQSNLPLLQSNLPLLQTSLPLFPFSSDTTAPDIFQTIELFFFYSWSYNQPLLHILLACQSSWVSPWALSLLLIPTIRDSAEEKKSIPGSILTLLGTLPAIILGINYIWL